VRTTTRPEVEDVKFKEFGGKVYLSENVIFDEEITTPDTTAHSP